MKAILTQPDSQAKLDGLLKFLSEHSIESAGETMIDDLYLKSLFEFYKDKEDKIGEYLDKLSGVTERDKVEFDQGMAQALLDNGVLLPRAQQFASDALALSDERQGKERATLLSVLGQVYLKEGKTDEARKVLNEALKGDSTSMAALAMLGELEARAQNYPAAINDFVTVAVSKELTAKQQALLETSYRNAHGGSRSTLPTGSSSQAR